MGQAKRFGPYDVAASIVAFHNPATEICPLVRSLQQSSLSVLVTVVDNSATDELRGAVEAEGAIYIHTRRNVGFGAGHNIALRRSLELARYHAIVNPDILLQPQTLESLFHFMEAHPEIGQTMPGILNLDGSEQRLTKRLPSPVDLFLRRFLRGFGTKLAPKRWKRYEMHDVDLSVPRDVPCLSGCFMFVRSSVLASVGFFDERYFMYMEDVDLCRRIGSVSRTVFCPETSVIHAYAKGSYKDGRLFRYHLRSGLMYFTKWGWFLDEERVRLNRRTETLSREAESLLSNEERPLSA